MRSNHQKLMLPIRLDTVNAKDTQELFFHPNKKGRIEITNYLTVETPSNVNIPLSLKDSFGEFYTAMFNQAVKEDIRKVRLLVQERNSI